MKRNTELRNTAKNVQLESFTDMALHFSSLNDEAKKKVIHNIVVRMRSTENQKLQQFYRWCTKNLENPKQHLPENLPSY